MSVHRILSVGQCAFDHGSLSRNLGQRLNARIIPADTFEDALTELRAGSFDLLLVNRVTDADHTAGLDLIRSVKADPALARVPTMLISDIAEAQARAVALGALPGFGKSTLHHSNTVARVEAALAPAPTPEEGG